ncbi:iron-siderophore ABC transporter substrate-binding protein, partial [Escherichia coli]|nr:iron-siderophore ABC transporter substrate-binding protein [Escherichia coli]
MMVRFLKQLSCTTLLFTVMITRANADITVHDAYGAVTFEQVPQRDVVLNWDILEQVLALDIEPIAAPNLPGYRQWVVNPYAPESIEDIGTRAEP